MLYNLSIATDAARATSKLEELIKEGGVVELKKKAKPRTSQQNKYLHLLLTWFAIEYGETVEYVKQVMFKRQVNATIFEYERVNKKTGEVRTDYRSTADISTAELSDAIERFRNYSSREANIYLPSANEDRFLAQIEVEAERYKHYL